MNYSDYWVYIRSWWLPWVIITHATFLLLYHTLQRKSDPTNLKIKIFSRERTCWSDKKIPRKTTRKSSPIFGRNHPKLQQRRRKFPKEDEFCVRNFYQKPNWKKILPKSNSYRKWRYKLWIMIVTTSIVFLISLWLYILKRRTAYHIPRLQESFMKLLWESRITWVGVGFTFGIGWNFMPGSFPKNLPTRIGHWASVNTNYRQTNISVQSISSFYILKVSFFYFSITLRKFMTNGLTRLCAVRCINVDNSIQMVFVSEQLFKLRIGACPNRKFIFVQNSIYGIIPSLEFR